MKFRPLHDRVVIRRVEGDDKTRDGIIIPDAAKEKPQEGEIVAIGRGTRDKSGKLVPIHLKKGGLVLLGKWSRTEVKINGQELVIVKETDIIGVIEGAAPFKKAA
jgi:chaperonin GroES